MIPVEEQKKLLRNYYAFHGIDGIEHSGIRRQRPIEWSKKMCERCKDIMEKCLVEKKKENEATKRKDKLFCRIER